MYMTRSLREWNPLFYIGGSRGETITEAPAHSAGCEYNRSLWILLPTHTARRNAIFPGAIRVFARL